MRKIWRLALVLVLLLSACELQANFVLDFDDDGSGDFTFELGFDEEMEQLLALGSDGEFDFNTLAEQFSADVPDAAIDEFERDGLRYFAASVPFADATDLDAEVFGNDSPFSDFSFTIDGDTAILDATVDTGGAFDTADLDPDEIPPGLDFNEVFGIHFQVRMPGEVSSHNADRVLSGGILEWDVPLVEGTPLVLQATSDLAGGGFPWGVVLIVGLLVIAALVTGIVMMNRRQAAPALAGTTTDEEPSTWVDSPPTEEHHIDEAEGDEGI